MPSLSLIYSNMQSFLLLNTSRDVPLHNFNSHFFKDTFPESNSKIIRLQIERSPLNIYIFAEYENKIQIIDINLNKRFLFQLEEKPLLSGICLDMLLILTRKNLYLHDLRCHHEFIKENKIFEEGQKYGLWEMSKQILIFSIKNKTIEFFKLDEVRGMNFKKDKQIALNQKHQNILFCHASHHGLCVSSQNLITVITSQSYRVDQTIELNFPQKIDQQTKICMTEDYLYLYKDEAIHTFKLNEALQLCTVFHSQKVLNIKRHISNEMILVDATGNVFAYGFDAIFHKGIVLPYIKELTNVGNIQNPQLLQINGQLALISQKQKDFELKLIMKKLFFPTLNYEELNYSSIVSFQSDFSYRSPPNEYEQYLDVEGMFNITSYLSDVGHSIKGMNIPLTKQYFHENIFENLLMHLFHLSLTIKGTLNDLDSNRFYWKLASIYRNQKWMKIMKQFVRVKGIEIFLDEIKLITFFTQIHHRQGIYGELLNQLKQSSVFYYPPQDESSLSQILSFLLYSEPKQLNGRAKQLQNVLIQSSEPMVEDPQLMNPLTSSDRKLEDLFDFFIKHGDLRYFLRKMKKNKFLQKDIFRACNLAYNYLCQKVDSEWIEGVEREDVEQMLELMMEVGGKISREVELEIWGIRQAHRYERNYEVVMDRKEIGGVLAQNEFRYDEEGGRRIREYIQVYDI